MPTAAISMTISVDTSGLDRIMPNTRPVAAVLLKKHAFEFESAAKERAPIDSGALRNSIHVSSISDVKAVIQDGVEYGIYQEFGVNHPYEINAPVHIPGVGWRFIKTHPGFPAQPFWIPAAEKVGAGLFFQYFPLLLQNV